MDAIPLLDNCPASLPISNLPAARGPAPGGRNGGIDPPPRSTGIPHSPQQWEGCGTLTSPDLATCCRRPSSTEVTAPRSPSPCRTPGLPWTPVSIPQAVWRTAPDPLQTHSCIQAAPGAFVTLGHFWEGRLHLLLL